MADEHPTLDWKSHGELDAHFFTVVQQLQHGGYLARLTTNRFTPNELHAIEAYRLYFKDNKELDTLKLPLRDTDMRVLYKMKRAIDYFAEPDKEQRLGAELYKDVVAAQQCFETYLPAEPESPPLADRRTL